MNYLGINFWNWEPELSDKCLVLPKKIADMGFTALEIPMTASKISKDLEKSIKESGLEVTLCASLGTGRDISNFDPVIRENTKKYIKECIETGSELGAYIFAGPLYAGGGKRHILSPEDKKREWDLAVTSLREMAHYAAEHGIKLALEPINKYRTSVANTVGQVLSMLEDINEPGIGLHFDTYQACIEEADLLASLDTALESGRTMHFHACANNRGEPGAGIIPWKEVFGLLIKHNYEGHITMETFAPGGLDASFINVLGTPDEIAERGIKFMKEFF